MRNRNNDLGQRIKHRLKGLMSLVLTAALLFGLMPAMQTEANSGTEPYELTEGDSFYFISNGYGKSGGVLCAGHEDENLYPGCHVYDPVDAMDSSSYICWFSGAISIMQGAPLEKLANLPGSLLQDQNEYVLREVVTDHETQVYCGTCFNSNENKYTQDRLELRLDGVYMAMNDGQFEDKKASFTLPAGRYKIVMVPCQEEYQRIIDFRSGAYQLDDGDSFYFVSSGYGRNLTGMLFAGHEVADKGHIYDSIDDLDYNEYVKYSSIAVTN